MKESGYYPQGAEYDSSAPWNKSVPDEKSFDVLVSQSLSKELTLSITDYDPDETDLYNIMNTNWENIYLEDHYSLIGIIQCCKQLANIVKSHKIKSKINLDKLIEDCNKWVEDEFNVEVLC